MDVYNKRDQVSSTAFIPENVTNNMHAPLPAVLMAEWDVLHTFFLSLQQFQYEAAWIKSHQDEKCAYNQLSFPAKLNCDADSLATRQHQESKMANLKLVPLNPYVSTQLVLHGNKTITNKIPSTLRYSLSYTPLQLYIAKRNRWTPAVSQLVDWKVFEKVTSKMMREGNQSTYSKWIHHDLPVNVLLHRRQKIQSPICKRCQQCDETPIHLITCPCSEQWFDHLVLRYRQLCKSSNMNFVAVELIITALTLHQQDKQLCLTNVPERFRDAIHYQNLIGWDNWYKGLVTRQWRILLLQGDQSDTKCIPIQSLLITTAQTWTRLWKLRNEIEHGVEVSGRQERKKQQIYWELESIYRQRSEYLPRDQEILFDSIEEHKSLSLHLTANWLNMYRGIFHKSIQTAKKNATHGVKSICKYFARIQEK